MRQSRKKRMEKRVTSIYIDVTEKCKIEWKRKKEEKRGMRKKGKY